jgi:hypothetical protein
MKDLLIALVLQVFTAGVFYRRIISSDSDDGDIGLGLLFWGMLAVYLALDSAWVGILIGRAS